MQADKKLILVRHSTGDQGTFGSLMVANGAGLDEICKVSELPDRGNARGLSCIPAGEYRVTYLARSGSGKYRDVYHVQNVPGRSGILIHKGNYVGDTKKGFLADSWGCLLPASRIGELSGQRAGLGSAGGLRKLHNTVGRKGFTLEIVDGIS